MLLHCRLVIRVNEIKWSLCRNADRRLFSNFKDRVRRFEPVVDRFARLRILLSRVGFAIGQAKLSSKSLSDVKSS